MELIMAPVKKKKIKKKKKVKKGKMEINGFLAQKGPFWPDAQHKVLREQAHPAAQQSPMATSW